MSILITILLLFFLPLLVVPVGVSFFETPKVVIGEAGILTLFLFALLRTPRLQEAVNPLLLKVVVVIFLVSLIDFSLTGQINSFFGNVFRLQGVFLLWHLLLFTLVSSSLKLDQKYYFFPLISLMILMLAVFVIGGNEAGRAVSTLGEPNALAATALFFLPFVMMSQSRNLVLAGILSTVIIIFMSGSRSGFLVLGFELVCLLLVRLYRLKTVWIVKVGLVIFFLSLWLPFIEGGGWFENRSEIWKTAVIAGLKNPLIGSGFGNIEHVLKQTSRELNNNVQYQYIDSAHNIFLDWWMQSGLVGLGCLIFLIGYSIKNFISKRDNVEVTALVAVLLMLSFNPASITTLVAIWWLIGQGFST